MNEQATELVQSLSGSRQLIDFARRLTDWLVADLNQNDEDVPDFTESRAKSLLRAANVVDDPTLHAFARLAENETAVRLALYDLLHQADLAQKNEIAALAAASAAVETEAHAETSVVPWLTLAIAAFAWKSGFPLYQLDPAAPPEAYSPAGQVIKRAAHFLRQQVQRSATERDKLGRKLAFDAAAQSSRAQTLDDLHADEPIAPLPPHFRPPIPVRYPEVARETIQVDADEEGEESAPVSRGEPITITDEDIPDEEPTQSPQVTTMPPIRIRPEQVEDTPERSEAPPRSSPRSSVTMPDATTGSGFADAVRQVFGRGQEPMKTTKLRVVVQEYPDGPGLYGLQVRVSCKGIKSYVAGTTNRDGKFLCELPVRVYSGLTYDVDVTWPRDMDGETERKSITLNAERTHFVLPFYRHLTPDAA